VLPGELGDQTILREVDVLVLVYKEVVEAILVALQHLGALLEETDDVVDQVVEVAGLVLVEPLLVERVDAGDDLIIRAASTPVEVVAGGDQLVLRLADGVANPAREELLRVELQVSQAVLHQRGLVRIVEHDEVGGHADRLAVVSQNAGADGMERAHPEALERSPE